MSTYVIGDVQGCLRELEALLRAVNFDAGQDSLWFVGDLINRGPDNRGVLDMIMGLPNVTCVLGNHDLHFLAIACGRQRARRGDTFDDLLQSPRLPEYIQFFRSLPLIHHDESNNLVVVHAGLPPQFSLGKCLDLAKEVTDVLMSDEYETFLGAMYGNLPARWDDTLHGWDRLRLITNYFTRMRYCKADGELELIHKADIQPEGYAPWFSFERQDDTRVLFGHWAALEGRVETEFVTALDTGCVWGRALTALRLEDEKLYAVNAIKDGQVT